MHTGRKFTDPVKYSQTNLKKSKLDRPFILYQKPDGSYLIAAREVLRQVYPGDRENGPLDPDQCREATWYAPAPGVAIPLKQFDEIVAKQHKDNYEYPNPSQRDIRIARYHRDALDHWLAKLHCKDTIDNFDSPIPLPNIDAPELRNALHNMRLGLLWETGVPSAIVTPERVPATERNLNAKNDRGRTAPQGHESPNLNRARLPGATSSWR